MLKMLREKFAGQDKKVLANLTTAFVIGVALIVCGNTLFKDKGGGSNEARAPSPVPATPAENESGYGYEERLEKRLKAVYETVDGAGKVSVMLTLSYGKEIVIAEDIVGQRAGSTETDSEGGRRETHSLNVNNTKIMIRGDDGISRPLVLKEIEPKVEGVIIVAQGGDNVYVADALIRATQTVLGIEPHKVQVLKMKSGVSKSADNAAGGSQSKLIQGE